MALNKLGRKRRSLKVIGGSRHLSPKGPADVGVRSKFRRTMRRNRVLLVTLLAVGALVAALIGIGGAGEWVDEGPNPEPRFGAASTFDQTRGEILIFGGFGRVGTSIPNAPHELSDAGITVPDEVPGTSITALSSTWGYKSSRNEWTNRNPIHHPSARGFAAMVYDGANRNVVLFGGALYGFDAKVSGETWIWDGVVWTLRNPPDPRPPARKNASMVYDAHRQEVVLFGGQNEKDFLGDTWIWDGSKWEKREPSDSPGKRHSAAMAYDLCRAETVLFGGTGTSPQDTERGQTWTWDGKTWTKEQPVLVGGGQTTPIGTLDNVPPLRYGASMAYSTFTGRVLMYGGITSPITPFAAGGDSAAGDENIWFWDGSGWEKEIVDPVIIALARTAGGWPSGLPTPRAYTSMVYDPLLSPASNPIRVFGGTPANSLHAQNASVATLLRTVPEHQLVLDDGWSFSEGSLTNPGGAINRCTDPVPLPAEEGGVVSEGPQLRRVENRPEYQEYGRVPVILGTNPNPYQGANPNQTPQPPCIHSVPPDEGLVEVGRSHIETDPKRNRVYQFFLCANNQIGIGNYSVTAMLMQAYDAATLKPLAPPVLVRFPGASFTYRRPGGSSLISPGIWYGVVMHDVERGVFLIRDDWNNPRNLWIVPQDLIEKGEGFTAEKITLPPAGSLTLFHHPETAETKLFIRNGTSLSQYDLYTGSTDWTFSGICSDQAGNGGENFMEMMRVENRVYVPCADSLMRLTVTKNPNGSESAGALETFVGPPSVSRAWADPGAERMLLESAPSGASPLLWTFDGKPSRWIGRSGLTENETGSFGVGFNKEIGRLFVLAPDHRRQSAFNYGEGGLLITDVRITPVPQPINFSQWMRPAQAPMDFLPPTADLPRRVFLRRAQGTTPSDPNDPEQEKASQDEVTRTDGDKEKFSDEMFYLVLADRLPVPQQPGVAQQDALTVPVVPNPAKTEVSFESEGSGYGVRLRVVGGFRSITGLDPRWEGFSFTPGCANSDREVFAGWVPQAQLSSFLTTARSTGLEVDSTTKVDLTAPSSRCSPPIGPTSFPAGPQRDAAEAIWPLLPFDTIDTAVGQGTVEAGGQKQQLPTNLAWDTRFKEVECVGDSSQEHKTDFGDVYGAATCNQEQSKVTATAKGAPIGSDLGISVAEGYSNVEVKRDPDKGVVVTATAVAKGTQIGPITIEGTQIGPITIDRVETIAMAWSNGRPAEERTSFTRRICGVHDPEGRFPNGCLSTGQQQQFVAGFNQAFGTNRCGPPGCSGKAIATLPTPDPEFLLGSPGGYISGITRPLAEEVEGKLFTRDFQKEVPGLQIEYIRDTPQQGPIRQIVQLAATRAISGFGVQCNSDRVYSPQANDCVPLPDDLPEDEYYEEDSEEEFEDSEFDADGEWTEVEAAGNGESLGKKIGRFLQSLPVISRLPIREIGEALLAWSVWLLLSMPLLLAWRRLSLNLGGSK